MTMSTRLELPRMSVVVSQLVQLCPTYNTYKQHNAKGTGQTIEIKGSSVANRATELGKAV